MKYLYVSRCRQSSEQYELCEISDDMNGVPMDTLDSYKYRQITTQQNN